MCWCANKVTCRPKPPVAPSVFEAGLPTLDYDVTESPHEVCARIRAAQRAGSDRNRPVGSRSPLLRTSASVLRDNRFVIPPGLHLTAQGVTSGPLWDRVVGSIICAEGAEHHRLRSLVSRAFTPRATARLHDTIGDVVNELVDRVAGAGAATSSPTSRGPIRSRSSARCLVRHARTGTVFTVGRSIFKMVNFSVNLVDEMPAVMRGWAELDAYVDDMVAERRQQSD